MIRLLPLLTASLLALSVAGPALAQQNLFAPRIVINDRAITNFEIAQRAEFLKLLGAGGDLEKLALEGLIEDRLRQQEAKRLGAKLEEKDLKAAMDEFAGRANVTAEEFVARIGAAGIAPETYRDFVSAYVIWREIVRAKFGASTKVTENEIDREIEAEINRTQMSYSISELVIGVPPGREAEALAFAEELRARSAAMPILPQPWRNIPHRPRGQSKGACRRSRRPICRSSCAPPSKDCSPARSRRPCR